MKQKEKVVLHLWFDTQAMEAAQFYTSIFQHSKVIQSVKISDTPSGEVELVSFSLENVRFEAISAGPFVSINDSMRLLVFCQSQEERDGYVNKLAGKVCSADNMTMVEDRFGVHWLFVMESDQTKRLPKICPLVDAYGKAKEMCDYYQGEFAAKTDVTSFEHNQWYVFELDNTPIIFADISHGPSRYTGALSLLYLCENQQEIDSFYQGFSAEVESEQCGWIVDKYGISWQIVPRMFLDFAQKLSPVTYQKINQQILTMKKIEIAQIEQLI